MSIEPIPAWCIEDRILTVRGQRVMLDSDLAELYGVETRAINQAVRRNPERFPTAFMFRLSCVEARFLRSQFVISEERLGKGGRRYLPAVFSEHGVLMLANVLRSSQAIAVSIQVIEAFVRLRAAIKSVPDLAEKIVEIENRLSGHDEQFKVFQEIILPLLTMKPPPPRKIGFDPGEGD